MIVKRKIRFTLKQIVKAFSNELFQLRINALLDWFKSNNKSLNFNPLNYYCGITNDIARRESEHNAKFLGYIKVENVHIARSIEIAMKHHYGYDTGRRAGNGGTSDSVFVYIYRKIPNKTIEFLSCKS